MHTDPEATSEKSNPYAYVNRYSTTKEQGHGIEGQNTLDAEIRSVFGGDNAVFCSDRS